MWKSGIKTDSELNADVSLSRVSIDVNGRLVVELRTRTRFRGLFLESMDKQGNLKKEASSFIAPMFVRSNFTLELVWSQDTFDSPEQVLTTYFSEKQLIRFLALESNLQVQS